MQSSSVALYQCHVLVGHEAMRVCGTDFGVSETAILGFVEKIIEISNHGTSIIGTVLFE